jgi:hypothetical protein
MPGRNVRSPLTNERLSHVMLTPNHNLRKVILSALETAAEVEAVAAAVDATEAAVGAEEEREAAKAVAVAAPKEVGAGAGVAPRPAWTAPGYEAALAAGRSSNSWDFLPGGAAATEAGAGAAAETGAGSRRSRAAAATRAVEAFHVARWAARGADVAAAAVGQGAGTGTGAGPAPGPAAGSGAGGSVRVKRQRGDSG